MENRVVGYNIDIASTLLPRRYVSPTLVARGGMAEVYRATDSVLGRPVAVKLLSERHSRESEVRTRFEREALTAAQLSGAKHVISVFDVGEHGGRPLIVMEYLDGGTVNDRLVRGRISPAQALEWLDQIAQALDKAHARGIVHRDVKPANLLLDQDGSIHVADFGIASATGLDTLTLPGTVLGTAGYLSPEQARGEPATPASDRYALGVVAFELLTGRRPFAADTPMTEAFAHLNAPVPSAQQVEPELPSGVDRVFARALAKNPDDRPASCGELVSALREALRAESPPTLIESGVPTRRMYAPPRRRPTLLAYVLGLGAIVLAGFVLATVLADGPTDLGARQATTPDRKAVSTPVETAERPSVDGAALNDAGFAHMQAGNYESALPLLRDAVSALQGSGSLTEAFASYNLAFTRFALGRCDGVLGLLDRSERIQGHREEIDDLRGAWDESCAEPAADGRGNGKGNGKGRGKGNDE